MIKKICPICKKYWMVTTDMISNKVKFGNSKFPTCPDCFDIKHKQLFR